MEWRQTPECVGVDYCMEGNCKHRVVDALLERKLLGKGAVRLGVERGRIPATAGCARA